MKLETFYDKDTNTLTYVVFDPKTRDAVVIDPVLDYEPKSSSTSTDSADKVIDYLKKNELNLHYILETHAHADHLSGSQYIKDQFPQAQVAIGEKITLVQKAFKNIFNLPEDFKVDGSQFDRLLKDGEEFSAGSLKFKTIFTPGHTPACASYLIDDHIFTGDALFMPDFGTGRCDFPGGSAEDLYDSVHERLYKLPDATKVLTGHDYQPGGRELKYESSIGEQKVNNIQLKAETSKDEFVKFRTERDQQLAAPKLLFQSVQVNADAGHLPPAEKNGIRYIKMPLNVFPNKGH